MGSGRVSRGGDGDAHAYATRSRKWTGVQHVYEHAPAHAHTHVNEGHMAEEITMKWEERKGGKTGEGRGEKMEN